MIESKELNEAILENLGAALIIIDDTGIIQRFTQAAENLFLYHRHEVIGKNVTLLMPLDFASHHQQYIKQHNPNARTTVLGKSRELKALRKDGSEFPVDITVTKVIVDQRVYFVGLLNDISEKLLTINQLQEAKALAEAANKAKGEFLGNMCHELRTPMNGVIGALQLLKSGTDQSQTKGLIDMAFSSSTSLLTIINDILDFSKIEANHLELEIVDFNLTDVVQDIAQNMSILAKMKHVFVNVQCHLPTNAMWLGDPTKIRQILNNILSNAVKFTETGHIQFTVQTETHGVLFSVTDTGIGMTDAELKTLFDRFKQADSSITRKYGGTGLGMAIVQQLVTLMGGAIQVKSQKGHGTTITVSLPLSSKPVELSENSDDQPHYPDLSNKTILIAEDNEINQLVLCEFLARTHAKILVAENGKQALDICLSTPVDLVLMDINMPEMDGIEALRLIRKNGFSFPVVAVTANTIEAQVVDDQYSFFNNVLTKPVIAKQLYATLERYLSFQ